MVNELVYGPREPGSIPLWPPFSSILLRVLMLNYFILVNWNYKKRQKCHSQRFYAELCTNYVELEFN